MQDVRSGRRSTRPKRARRDPATVTVRHLCPTAAVRARPARSTCTDCAGSARWRALEALAAAVLGGAERSHLEHVVQLAARVEQRDD